MNLKKIKRAIISVSDKSNLKEILPTLKKFKIEIISSGGTFKKILNMIYNCVEDSNYTKFSVMLDGRVKTLHPKIHWGILAKRNLPNHLKELKQKLIDYVLSEKFFDQKKLLIDNLNLKLLGENAKKRSMNDFNWEKVINDYCSIFFKQYAGNSL